MADASSAEFPNSHLLGVCCPNPRRRYPGHRESNLCLSWSRPRRGQYGPLGFGFRLEGAGQRLAPHYPFSFLQGFPRPRTSRFILGRGGLIHGVLVQDILQIKELLVSLTKIHAALYAVQEPGATEEWLQGRRTFCTAIVPIL